MSSPDFFVRDGLTLAFIYDSDRLAISKPLQRFISEYSPRLGYEIVAWYYSAVTEL